MAANASDDLTLNFLGRLAQGWRNRLAGSRAVLLTTAAVFLVFLGIGSLTPLEAAIGFAAIVVVALMLPQSLDIASDAGPGDLMAALLQDDTVRLFADALADPCIILDGRSVVVHRNPAALSQFPGATIGNPIAFSLRNPPLLSAIEAARKTGISQTVELHQTVPNETWHKVVVSPLPGGKAGPESEQKLLVVTMQSLTEAKRVDAMRSDFIANASHELRTPLTSLVGFIDTLLGPAARDPEARKKFLGIMRVQAARMSKLIEDLLSLNRIEMRQHLRPTGTVDLASLLREVNEGLTTQAEEAGVIVTIDAPATPATITADRDELYEVFENLLDNAIKYGGDGGRVEMVLVPFATRPGYDYAVTVTDHGAGIETEHVPRLTERFYRVDAESSRKKKGTGLGLAIVKHILNRHRGVLTIKSRPGEGTRVEVLLPR